MTEQITTADIIAAGKATSLTAAVLARDTARASELMRQHLLTPIPIIQQAMAGN